MTRIYLLSESSDSVFRLLDSLSIPELQSLEDMPILISSIGNMLKSYVEILSDPNLVSVTIDPSIKDWTITDLESIQASLKDSKMRLVIFQDEEPEVTVDDNIMYLLLDRSNLHLGFLPKAVSHVAKRDDLDLPAVFRILLSGYNYFSPDKFILNPINQALDSLDEARELLGAVDQFQAYKLTSLLTRLNKEIIAITSM